MAKKHNFITFSGMDGTGKTTLAMRLGEYMKRKKQHIHVIHGHQYATVKKSLSLGAQDVQKYRFLFRMLTPLAYVDNLYTYYSQYLPHFTKETLICDRYFYDKIARMLFYGILTKPMAYMYLKLLPQPTHSFFLDLNAQTAFDRKAEYTLEEYKRFRAIYRDIATQMRAPIINTSGTIEQTLQKIIDSIHSHA